jgi:hypothetical protein
VEGEIQVVVEEEEEVVVVTLIAALVSCLLHHLVDLFKRSSQPWVGHMAVVNQEWHHLEMQKVARLLQSSHLYHHPLPQMERCSRGNEPCLNQNKVTW